MITGVERPNELLLGIYIGYLEHLVTETSYKFVTSAESGVPLWTLIVPSTEPPTSRQAQMADKIAETFREQHPKGTDLREKFTSIKSVRRTCFPF